MASMFRDKIKNLLREARILEEEQKDRIVEARARHETSWRFKKPDRIPVKLGLDPVWSDWYYNVKIGRLWNDPKLLVECELRTWIDSFKEDRAFVIPDAVTFRWVFLASIYRWM
jgi:hypothetical protein